MRTAAIVKQTSAFMAIALITIAVMAATLMVFPTTVEASAGVIRVNKAPVALFVYSPSPAPAGQAVLFDASDSYDPDGNIVRYEWDFTGAGHFDVVGQTATWLFEQPGTYPVTLRVVDNMNTSAQGTLRVKVDRLGAGQVEARFSYAPERPRPGQFVTFDASASTFSSEPVTYQWDLTGDGRFDAFGPVVSRRYDRDGVYRVTLRIQDGYGRRAETTRIVQVGKGLVRVVLESEPSDVTVYIDGIERGRTPITLELEPERHQLRLKHYWRGEWETELDLRSVAQLTMRIVLR